MFDSFEVTTDGDVTVLTRTRSRGAFMQQLFHGGLVLLALSGLAIYVLDDHDFVSLAMILLSILVMTLGIVPMFLGVRGPRMRKLGRRLAMGPDTLELDGEKLTRTSVRGVVCGHWQEPSRYGTKDWYPVYVALEDGAAIEIDTFPDKYGADEMAKVLSGALGSMSVTRVETGASAMVLVALVAMVVLGFEIGGIVYGLTTFTDRGHDTTHVALAGPLIAAALFAITALGKTAARGLLANDRLEFEHGQVDEPPKKKKKKKKPPTSDVPG